VRSCVTGSEEEGETESQTAIYGEISDVPWVNHVIDELVAESPHLQTNSDGNQSEKDLEPPHPSDSSGKSLDILLMLVHELGGEEVCPELESQLGSMSV